MSFLTRTTLRLAPRTTTFAPRAFSTSFIAHKSTTETVKDTVHSVDKKVASKIVDGIETAGMSLFTCLHHLYIPFICHLYPPQSPPTFHIPSPHSFVILLSSMLTTPLTNRIRSSEGKGGRRRQLCRGKGERKGIEGRDEGESFRIERRCEGEERGNQRENVSLSALMGPGDDEMRATDELGICIL